MHDDAHVKVAILTTDNRSAFQQFERETPWFGAAPEALLAGFASMPELEVHVVSCTRQPVNAPEKLADNIWFHSLHVPKIGWMRTGYQGCIRAVRRRLRLIQPDLVHGQGTELESAICAAYSGYPNVITLLGIMREMSKVFRSKPGSFHWCASVLESIALRRTAGVLCNSHYTEEKVRSRTRKTWLVPNAIRPEFFANPVSVTQPPECTLMNVGSICSYKRQNELLDVLEELHKEGLRFKMQFVGAPAEDAYAQSFLHRLQNRPYACHLKFKSVGDLIEHYDAGSALVHVSSIETFGLVVAEALSRNLKLFGFNLGGVTDIGAGMEGAELLPEGDWAGLKSALTRWIQAGHPRPTQAAHVIRQRYHPAEIARQHWDIYRSLSR
ncbi:MAG: glycosyltransferase family 4 protein [Verrucomicrobiota bacterium]